MRNVLERVWLLRLKPSQSLWEGWRRMNLSGRCWHSFVLIKRLWTRFGNSIRHIWHEECRRYSNRPLLSCWNVLHIQPHPRTFFEQKELLKYLFICPPSYMFIDAHNLCNHRSLYSLYSLSATTFHFLLFFFSCVTPPTGIDQRYHPPFILVDKHIVYSFPWTSSNQTRLFFLREHILHHFFNLV